MNELAFIRIRNSLLKLINKIPYLRLELENLKMDIVFPPDAFGALEENLLTGRNIYFDEQSIYRADTIIDLGAHSGSFTLYSILHSKPGTKIVAVEPNERNYKLLLANLKLLENIIKEKKLRVLPLRKAVWIKRGVVRFIETGWSEGGYISVECDDELSCVDAITLDDIIEISSGRIIAKIDIEGAETPVLATSKKLEAITELAIEAHGNEHQLVKLLKLHRFNHCIIIMYKLTPYLSKNWLTVKPSIYGLATATYRFLISAFFHPTITIIKASK
jgi:methyltransferase, FkbM family